MDETDAEAILAEADSRLRVKQMALERARYHDYPDPETPKEYLAWIEREARAIQAILAQDASFVREEVRVYAQALNEVAERLRAIGVEPAPLENMLHGTALRRRIYFARREHHLLEQEGSFSWGNRQWRNHWLVTHFQWAYLCWLAGKSALGLFLRWGMPALLIFGLGLLVGHLWW